MTRINKYLGTPLTHEESLRRSRIIKNVEQLIKTVGVLLLFFFGWLNFKDFPYISLFNDDFSTILLKISLALYYTSWIFGTSTDLKDEEYTFLAAPNKGKLTIMAISIIFMMGVLFAILCLSNNFKLFSVALFVFLLIDKLGNIYLNRFVRHSIEESKKAYIKNKNYVGYLSIISIQNFLSGKYTRWRFLIGFILISILILFSFTDLPNIVANLFQINSSKLILSIIFFVYVFSIEVWIWTVRLKRKVYFSTLNEISKDYTLTIKIK